MTRHPGSPTNGQVDQFECPDCSHRLYLGPVSYVAVELPMQARARLTLHTDGMFWLDHERHEATCVDECDAAQPQVKPWRGILAELSFSTVNDRAVTHLKLIGEPFNGRTSYQVI